MKMTVYEWWDKNYRYVIYALLIVFAIIPYLNPIGLPISISVETRAYFDVINDLPEGSKVLMLNYWSAGAWGEVAGGTIATIEHCVRNDLKIVFASIGIEGPALTEKVLSMVSGGRDSLGEYGVDWVHLGFLPGGETAMAMMIAPPDGFHKAYAEKDFYGNDFNDLRLMDEVMDANSIDVLIFPSTSGPAYPVRQMYVPYNVPCMTIDIGVDWPETKMFIDTGQIAGGLASLRGSAEYELLVQRPGMATSSIEALSFNHLLIIAFLIVGNVEYLLKRRKSEKEGVVS